MTTPRDPEVTAAREFAGDADGLQRLWTPHRMAYIGGEAKPADSTSHHCPFCAAASERGEEHDRAHLVVKRGQNALVICNLYPYNSGHLLVCSNRHVADYTELTTVERDEIALLTQQAMAVLRAVMGPHGFNLGMNQGEVAGAGIAAHLHQHVVPRWSGDANFFPIVAQTKAVPQLLADTRRLLADTWDQATATVSSNESEKS
ncbi:Diadenosine tetraphosphate (Ap4A) hydrolase [Micrococcales bacterium KH10]|nr:Diadenosine tetraphosphate (Ap4A) hydrolase [Micrococcales bacterium KH10]